MGTRWAVDWQMLGVLVVALAMFGVLYNQFVGRLGEHKEGYTGLLVVAGVSVILAAGLLLIPWQQILVIVSLFAAAGLPMVLGEIGRVVRMRQATIQRAREQALREAGDEQA